MYLVIGRGNRTDYTRFGPHDIYKIKLSIPLTLVHPTEDINQVLYYTVW